MSNIFTILAFYQSVLNKFHLKKCSTITNEDLDEIMMAYNMVFKTFIVFVKFDLNNSLISKNTSDEIEGEELNKLAKDLLEITHQVI